MSESRKVSSRQRRNKRLILFIGIIVLLAGLPVLAYQIPSIRTRLDWRVETARVFLSSLVKPIKEVPTSVSSPPETLPILSTTNADPFTPVISPTVPSTLAATDPSIPPASTSVTPTPAPLSVKVILASPSFEGQDWNNCGPVSLSMYLNFYGWDGDQYDISDEVKPLRADRNVNVDELASYVYKNIAWLKAVYRVDGDIRLLRSLINSGFPVMVEETAYMEKPFWANDDLWAGHYLLLTGYDDELQSFTTQDSLVGPDRKISYIQLDTNWQAFNRVYLLLYPPERENEVISILGDDWNVDQNRKNALLRAQQETTAQPDNVFSWFNLGSNLVYFERYTEAAQAFDRARTLDMPQRMLRYQFSPFLAYFHSGRTEDLLTLADYALTVTPNSEEALLWKGWALYRSNSTLEAIQSFQKALEYNPNYTDAQYAIQFVQGQ
ncbi:MAG: C39 family peptidase [Chloroflexi bacterium]|nr:C39 family peptidase [Chloroflexota bacterium]